MCRLLGYAAASAVRAVDVLGAEQTALFASMARLHDDGWGTMWLDPAGRGVLRAERFAHTGHESERLREALTEQASPARVVHLRMATDDMDSDLRNTHPFVRGNLGAAHNGSIVPTQALRARLSVPFLLDVEGETDSELYFALLRQNLAEVGDLTEAVALTVTTIRALYPAASLNAMVLSPQSLIVVRSSAHAPVPLDDFAASGLAEHELPLDHCDAYFRIGYRALDDGGWVFASTGMGSDGWLEMPENSIAEVDLVTLHLRMSPMYPELVGTA